MDARPDERKTRNGSGISAVFSSWAWKDLLLVVNILVLLLVVLAYLTNQPGISVPLPAPATSSVPSSSSEPYVCPSGGWLAPSSTGQADPWLEMKITLRPARCLVKGKWAIEELDPEHNFRRMWSLAFTGDVEDKYQVLPYMLATQDTSLVTRNRRVYIDFGANRWDTSIYWMARNYPVDFTEIYAFEVSDNVFVIPDTVEPQLHPMGSNSRLLDGTRTPHDIPKWFIDRINFRKQYVTGQDDLDQGRISATRFIKEELKLTKDDTVIIKMDIESSEWDILPQWLADPEMPDIIDELFVEIHYRHPTMSGFGWDLFSHTLEEATDLFVQMREKGFYVHTWP